jgi:hypothetical protein
MLQDEFHVSERRACRLVGQPRGTQRYLPTQAADEDALTQAIVALAAEYGRYGYRRIPTMYGRMIVFIMPPMMGAVCG